MKMKNENKVIVAKLLLKTTFIMLWISVFLKLAGLEAFDADVNNKILLSISQFIDKLELGALIKIISIYFQYYVIYAIISLNKNYIVIAISSIISSILYTFAHRVLYLLHYLDGPLLFITYILLPLAIILTISILIDIKSYKSFYNTINIIFKKVIYIIVFCIFFSFVQFLLLYLKSISYLEGFDTIFYFLLSFDYLIILFLLFIILKYKDWNIFLNNPTNFHLTQLLNKKLSKNKINYILKQMHDCYNAFKKVTKFEKIVGIVYLILFILSELFNVLLIVFVASINNVIIECLFILTSFSISRKIFGAFHFDSAIKCWLLSNILFFILNKLTINVGISIIVPLILGVLLSYITSKFIKNNSIELKRGITEKEFNTLVKNKKLSQFETELLYDFYCKKISLIKLAIKYNYSRTMICEYKKNAVTKITNKN